MFLLAAVLAVDWRRRLTWRGLGVGAAVAGVVSAPLAVAILLAPDVGLERVNQVWIFSRSDGWPLFLRQLTAHLGLFGFTGDPIWIHNLPYRTPVYLPVALCFWLAVARGWREAGVRTLIWWVAVMIWPGVLAASDLLPAPPPNHLRILDLAPAAFLLAAVGIGLVGRARPQAGMALAVVLLLLDGGRTLYDYPRWAAAQETYEQYDADMAVLAQEIAGHPQTFYLIPLTQGWSDTDGRHYSTIDYLTNRRANYAVVPKPYLLPEMPKSDESRQSSAVDAQASGAEVVLVRWFAGMHQTSDPQHRLELALNLGGYRKSHESQGRTYALYHYRPTGEMAVQTELLRPIAFSGGLVIERVTLYQSGHGDDMRLLAALRWTSPAPYAQELSVSVRLHGVGNAAFAQVDSRLVNEEGKTATGWATSEQGVTVVELPAQEAPPGRYSVEVILYDTMTLAPVTSGDALVGPGEFTIN